jgi:hypothetical protein
MGKLTAINLLKESVNKADELPRIVLDKKQATSSKFPFQNNEIISPRIVIPTDLAKNAVSVSKPSVDLRKSQLMSKINQAPDIGESFIAPYNKFEEVVQKVEQSNDALQNMQFGLALGAASPNLKTSSISGKALNKLAPISKASDIVEKALWVGDAVRALGDSEYRAEADKGMGKMVDSNLEGADLFLQALQYVSQRPIAFGGATLRGLSNGINSEKQQALEEMSEILDAEISVKKDDVKSRILPKGWKVTEKQMTPEDYAMLDAAKKLFNQ